jgi:pilus assembly protein Flp/PilA
MITILASLLENEDGPTASEYAVMLALIVLVAVGAITLLGNRISNVFTFITGNLS